VVTASGRCCGRRPPGPPRGHVRAGYPTRSRLEADPAVMPATVAPGHRVHNGGQPPVAPRMARETASDTMTTAITASSTRQAAGRANTGRSNRAP